MLVVETSSNGAEILGLPAAKERFVVRFRRGVDMLVSSSGFLAARLVVNARTRDILVECEYGYA